MKVSYSAQLMEESVFRHLNHLERSGYRSDYDEFHSLADPIYELPEDDREIAFEKVNRLFFLEKLKLGDHVLRALEAVGLIPKRKRTSRKSALLNVNQEAEPAEGLEEIPVDTAELELAEERSWTVPEQPPVYLFVDARGKPARCAAVLYADGVFHYTDGMPAQRFMDMFEQRADNNITSLEILAIAVGLSTFESELAGRKVVLFSDNTGAEVCGGGASHAQGAGGFCFSFARWLPRKAPAAHGTRIA